MSTVDRGVRVSIVTPFLNAGRFIEECIESALAQTYDAWELLLVDDGSTDDSTSIALRYARAYPERIRYLAHDGRCNRGASASRNLAARHATGEYLAFLDADDVYLPGKLAEQVPLLDTYGSVAMIYAATEYWYSWSGRAEDAARDWTWRHYGAPPNTIVDPPRMLLAFLRDGGTVPCMGSVLVRKTAVQQVGGWEESFRYICTDQVFHAKLCLKYPVMVVDDCWDRYRQHEASSCQTVERAGQADAALLGYLRWLESYLSREARNDREVCRALRTAMRRHRHPHLHQLKRKAIGIGARLTGAAGKVIAPVLPRQRRRRA
jgi:glycosyltransferase involved in cell wall biosynthesis